MHTHYKYRYSCIMHTSNTSQKPTVFLYFLLFFIFIESRFFSHTAHPNHSLLPSALLPLPLSPDLFPLPFLLGKEQASYSQQANMAKQDTIRQGKHPLRLRLDKATQ